MNQSFQQKTKSLQNLPQSTYSDQKIESLFDDIKETLCSKKKSIRKRNYQRRKKLYIVHNVCIINKNDPSLEKGRMETFLIQDKKPRHWNGKCDVLNMIKKKDDQCLKKLIDKEKSRKYENINCEINVQSPLKIAQEQKNQNYQNMPFWNGQVFQYRNIPVNLGNLPSNPFYHQYNQYMNWMGMMG